MATGGDGGGYDPELFKYPPPSSTFCPICRTVFRDATELAQCGHCYCRGCITEWIRTHDNATCPECRVQITRDSIETVGRVVQGILGDLIIKCPERGCFDEMPLRNFEDHRLDCAQRRLTQDPKTVEELKVQVDILRREIRRLTDRSDSLEGAIGRKDRAIAAKDARIRDLDAQNTELFLEMGKTIEELEAQNEEDLDRMEKMYKRMLGQRETEFFENLEEIQRMRNQVKEMAEKLEEQKEMFRAKEEEHAENLATLQAVLGEKSKKIQRYTSAILQQRTRLNRSDRLMKQQEIRRWRIEVCRRIHTGVWIMILILGVAIHVTKLV